MSSHLLILPRLRVQNANCISSAMTWGFPAITAFTGLMVALERRLGRDLGLRFESVGVICHAFEAQATTAGYTRSFHLTRNPVLQDGSTAAIVEEGRAHMEVTLVFGAQTAAAFLSDEERQTIANAVGECAAGMRIAGGSVIPRQKGGRGSSQPRLLGLSLEPSERAKQFRLLRRQWLPGFALVARDDLLQKRWRTMLENHPADASTGEPTLLDAWLDLSRINYRATHTDDGKVEWKPDGRDGWLVPIPVGYAALTDLHPPGSVANARDMRTPFRWVESIYSIGQWISPHRLTDATQFMWKPEYEPELGMYRCTSGYEPSDSDKESLELTADSEQDTTLNPPQFD